MSQIKGTIVETDLHKEYHYHDFERLAYEDVQLHFNKVFLYGDDENMGYEFTVKYQDKDAGILTAIINNPFEADPLEGNVGLQLNDAFLSLNIPYKVAKAVTPLFKFHDHDQIDITFDKGNKAIEKACTDLSAKYLDTVETDDGKAKVRYTVDL